MKRYLKTAYLSHVALGCGAITCLLRLWLLSSVQEGQVLLAAGSFPDVMSWILVAVTTAVIALGAWNLREGNHYSYNFPPSIPAAIGMALAAVSFCITSAVELSAGTDTIGTASSVLGFVSTAALLVLAYGRLKGLHLNMLFHGIVCLYLMLYLVSHYRLWSASPQLQTYAFELLAIVFVMLACYHRAAFDANSGKRRAYTFFSLAALFFCVAALPSCDNMAFFIGCGVWMYTTPCRLTLPARKED